MTRAATYYTVDAKTKNIWLLDGVTRPWSGALLEVDRLKRLLRPIVLQVHVYREGDGRRFWVKGWARDDRRSPWKPVKEEP